VGRPLRGGAQSCSERVFSECRDWHFEARANAHRHCFNECFNEYGPTTARAASGSFSSAEIGPSKRGPTRTVIVSMSVSLLGLFQHTSGRPAFHVQFQGAGGDPRLDTPATARCRTVSFGSASTFLLGWPLGSGQGSVSSRPVQPPSELEGRCIVFPPSSLSLSPLLPLLLARGPFGALSPPARGPGPWRDPFPIRLLDCLSFAAQ